MKIDAKDYRVKPGSKVRLKQWATRAKRVYTSKVNYQSMLTKHRGELSRLQSLLYASDRHALLLIFQAMDAAGKDGVNFAFQPCTMLQSSFIPVPF